MQDFYRVIGLMSGSSLDGLDIACCAFQKTSDGWSFTIEYAVTAPYTPVWMERLRDAHSSDGKSLWQLHAEFGHFCGASVRDFVKQYDLKDITLIASHGHTVFHYPQNHFTTQIGDGAALAVQSGLPVICDFRSTDVAKNGQGAPLVPMGDKILFKDFPLLLNIGGIANVTLHHQERVAAFDICPANQILNKLAQQKNQAFDQGGKLAASGSLHHLLFNALNLLDYYTQPYPKSLGNDYTRDVVWPLVQQHSCSTEDALHSFVEHIAFQIGTQIKTLMEREKRGVSAEDKLLVTGGGALNTYLIERIRHYLPMAVQVPDLLTVQYKEALVFALLGLLRWRNETNILRSVTGATTNSIAGAIYLP